MTSSLLRNEPVFHAKYVNGMVATLSEQAPDLGEPGSDPTPFTVNIVHCSVSQTSYLPVVVGKAWAKPFGKELSRSFISKDL